MKIRQLASALVAAGLLSTLAACGGGSGTEGEAAEPFTIGVIRPQSGGLAQYGARYESGVQLAVDRINSEGGLDIGGTKVNVEVAFCDSEADAAQAATCGRKLSAEQGAPVVLTSMSLETFPNMAINATERNPFILIAGSASNRLVTEGNPNVARYWFNTYKYMPEFTSLLAVLLDEEGVESKNIAILYSEDETGKSWEETFEPGWEAAGGVVTGKAAYKQGDADFYTQLTSLMRGNPDFIALPASCTAVTPAVVQARELGYEGQFLFAASCTPGEMFDAVGADEITGSVFEGTAWDLGSDYIDNFVAAHEREYGAKPTIVEGVAYAHAMWAIRSAVEAQSTTDVNAIRAAMPAALDGDANFLGLRDMEKNGETSAPIHPRFVKSDAEIIDFLGN